MRSRVLTVLAAAGLCLMMLAGCGGTAAKDAGAPEKVLTVEERADQIVAGMSTAEKVGQLVMIGVQGTEVNDDSLFMLHQYHMGGVILFDRNLESAEQTRKLTSDLQAQAGEKVPLFIGIDEEGGRVVRGKAFIPAPPSQQEIGRSGDVTAAREQAAKTAGDLRALGVNVNFAPVADVSATDPRSYSGDAKTAAAFVDAAAQGYRDGHIIYALKHFPGIGRGTVDSHQDISSVNASKETLLQTDLVPFRQVMARDTDPDWFVLVSHLNYPALDRDNPASLSKAVMTDFLRGELGYNGLVITDDLEMGAVSRHHEFRDLGVQAVLAGADVVMVCHEYPHETDVYLGLLDAVENGTISQARLDESVRRVVLAKLRMQE